MHIIGITGTLGAGKGTIVSYLVTHHGYAHYSVRSLLTSEIRARGLPVDRDSMVVVANDLRRSHTPSYLVECLYEQAHAEGRDAVIESIRTPGEVSALRSRPDFVLFAVDASPRRRYRRILQRGSDTDRIGYDEFLAQERREMTSEDPHQQNLSACMGMADYSFTNDSDTQSLYRQVEEALEAIDL